MVHLGCFLMLWTGVSPVAVTVGFATLAVELTDPFAQLVKKVMTQTAISAQQPWQAIEPLLL